MDEYEVIPIDVDGPTEDDVIPTEDEQDEAVIDDEEYDPTDPTDPGQPEESDEGPVPEPEYVIGPDDEDIMPTEEEAEEIVVDDAEYSGGDEPEPDVNDNEAEIAMVGAVSEGDVFPVLKMGSSLMGIAPAGWGDRMRSDVDLASQAATEAKAVAQATGQHFWEDDNGAHVTEITKDDWKAEEAKETPFADVSDSKPYHNLLMNSFGILLRTALKKLVSITRSAIAFFDGEGNNAANVVASFGKDGAQVGPSSKVHSVIEPGSFTIRDRNESTFVDFHLANDDNTGYVIVPWSVTADGDTTVFTFRSNVLDVSVRVNGTVVSSGWHLDGNSIVFDTAPAAGSAIDFIITTDEPVPVMTIGRRKDGTEEGKYSRVLGVDCTASGYISEASGYQSRALDDECHAEGYMTKASGWAAHAEGVSTQAEGDMSHAEGLGSLAMGTASHASGHLGIAAGECSHAEGHRSMATGDAAHAQNSGTIAASTNQTALGRWNVSDTDETFAVIIGNGTAQSRRNAMGILWSGNTRRFLDVDTRQGGTKPSSNVNVGEQVNDSNGGQVFYSYTTYTAAGTILRSQIIRKLASDGSELATNGLYYGIYESGAPYWEIKHVPQFRTAIGLGIYASLTNQSTSLTLTTSAQKVPLHGSFAQYGGCSESSNGIKVPVAGVYLITGLVYLTTGFAENDMIHVELRKNDSSLCNTLCRVCLANAYQSFAAPTQIVSLAANDVITLHAWNQTAARGTVSNRDGHGIMLVKIA